MEMIVAKNYAELSRRAADVLGAQVLLKPTAVLGLATGSTPVGAYQELVARNRRGELDFSRVKTVNLDEYVGLAPDHNQSYRYFMQTNLFDHINIEPGNTHVPNGLASDLEKECRRYDNVIQKLGGIDLQLLGIGHDGHIGFNEPADHFVAGTNCVTLTEQTIDANARFFAHRDEVPRQALTMGIRAIMQARHILMIVNGADKADIVRAAFAGPVTPQVPASILQLHPRVTLIGDAEAMSKL